MTRNDTAPDEIRTGCNSSAFLPSFTVGIFKESMRGSERIIKKRNMTKVWCDASKKNVTMKSVVILYN